MLVRLVLFHQTLKPDLTIIDAIDAMEGNGPTGGSSHPLHMLLAARDVYTQDYFAAGLMGLDPMDIVMGKHVFRKRAASPVSAARKCAL